MSAKVWSLLDATPEKHIHEPVVASCVISPRGSAKHHMMMVAVGGVIKGIVPGENAGAELVKMGLEHGAEFAADKLQERAHEGEVELPPKMYLVVGPSKLGLYAVFQRSLIYWISKELVLVPHAQVAELTIGEAHMQALDLTLRLTTGVTLELECGRGDRQYIEAIQAGIRPANQSHPSGPLPPQGYGVQPPAPAFAPPKTREQWLEEGRAYTRARRFQEALAAYEAALQLDPNFGYAHFARGEALRVLNRPEEALLAFERAMQLAPQDAAPYRHSGYVLTILKRYGEALAVLEQAIRLDPGQAGAYTGKGDALNGLNRPEEALAAYDRALALDAQRADAALGKGDALCALGQYSQALAAYDLALHLEPDNATAAASKSRAQQFLAQPARPARPEPGGASAQQVAELPARPSQAFEATERVSRPLAAGPKGVLMLPSGRRVALLGAQAVVGRGPLVGPDAVEVDLTSEAEKQTVSRRHACITRGEAGFELEDLDSANQTRLNHEPLQPGRRYLLHHGDVVEFGNVACAFTIE